MGCSRILASDETVDFGVKLVITPNPAFNFSLVHTPDSL